MKTDIDKLLEQALKSDLPMQLPGDFARKVVTVYARRKAWRQHLHEFIIYASVIMSCLATGLAIVYFFGTERWQEWSQFFYSHYAFLAVILLLALFILFADKVILPLLFIMGKKKKNMDVSF